MQLQNAKALMITESQKTLNPSPESRPPSLEDAPIHAGTPWPEAGKMLGNLFETRKDWLIPPNYTNDSNISADNATRLKPLIKVETKPEGQPTTSPKAENVDGDQTAPSTKTKKKTGMGTSRSSSNNSCHIPGTDDPNAAPSGPELPKTPKLSEVQFKDI